MTWRDEVEKLLRDNIRYCYASGVEMDVDNFQDMLGLLQEHIYVLLKRSYLEGYAQGIRNQTLLTLEGSLSDKVELSRFPAERAWEKSEMNV